MQVHINLATTRHELKPSGRLDALQQPLRDPMAHGLPLDFNSVPKVADQVVMQVTRRDERSVGLHAREMTAVRNTRCLGIWYAVTE
jgi:hypothetical protein